MSFNFNSLSDTEFEEFCFDLLKSLDFVNLTWRKGTGLSSSPSDQGRDIQAELLRTEVDGTQHHEKWFVECKHHMKGVSPEKLQGAIAWANAERPGVLLFCASNFLSNQAKNYLADYERNNNPSYRMKFWELKDLENLTAENYGLRMKYGLSTELAFLKILNKYHLIYAMKPQFNSAGYFIELMDTLDPEKRDEAFSGTYSGVAHSQFRQPGTHDETLAELMADRDDYSAFRAKLLADWRNYDSSPMYIHGMVTSALSGLFLRADKTSAEQVKELNQLLIQQLAAFAERASTEEEKARLRQMLQQNTIDKLPERTERFYKLYTYICDELVRKLLSETPLIVSHLFSIRDLSMK
jgi:hypothetical protein